MQKKYFAIFLTLLTFNVLSQNKIDSLRSLLLKTDEQGKIEIYAQLAKEYYTINPDSILFYGKQAVALAEKFDDTKTIGKAYIAVGVGYQNKTMYAESQDFFSKALEIGNENNDLLLKSRAYNNMGNNYFFTTELEKAIEMYIKSQEIDEILGDFSGLIKTNTNLGIMYARLKQYDRSVLTYQKALSFAIKKKMLGLEVQIKVGLMNVYYYKNVLDSSIYYGRDALLLSKDNNMAIGIARTAAGLSPPLIKNGMYTEGLEVAQLAEKYMRKYDDIPQANYAMLNQGFAYEGLKKYNKAIDIVNYLRKEKVDYLEEIEKLMYKIEKGRGNYKAALKFHEKYNMLTDSVRKKENVDRLAKLEKKYETEKNERAIERLEQQAAFQKLEIKQKNTVLLVIGVVVLLFSTAIYLIYQQKRLKHHRAISDMEQKFLRFQMNPHFIFNSLTSIQNFMFQNDAPKAGVYMAKFAKLMRQILENSRQDFIAIDEEIDTLENYMSLQKLRFNNKFNYQINIADDIDIEETKIPPMFAQPFIENSLEHGIFHNEGDGLITVNFSKSDNLLKIEVIDNGVGYEESNKRNTRQNHKSLATQITKERISLFNKDLKDKIQLVLENDMDLNGNISGAKVNVLVPYMN